MNLYSKLWHRGALKPRLIPWNNPRYPISAPFCSLKISVRSQNWCLTIPKLVPDYPKTGAWLSQNWCLTIVRHHFWDIFWDPKYNAWQPAVQTSTDQLVVTRESDPSISVQFQHASFWTAQILFPSGHQLICTLLYSQLSGIIFGVSENIPEMVPDNCQAPVLG